MSSNNAFLDAAAHHAAIVQPTLLDDWRFWAIAVIVWIALIELTHYLTKRYLQRLANEARLRGDCLTRPYRTRDNRRKSLCE